MRYTQDCFGSRLEITLFWDAQNDRGIRESFQFVESFENDYSRFIEGNILSAINTGIQSRIDPEISALIRMCIKISKLTQGYFDITLLPVLENAGYGIQKDQLKESCGYENIELIANNITLKKGIQIELGSCGKGYMLDFIYTKLKEFHTKFIINFWGDIRVSWQHTIQLEDPLDTNKYIGIMELDNLSIASSSGNRRKIGEGHHLIDMKGKTSQDDKIAIYVTHKLWVFADSFATALFVTPLDLSLKILESVEWLEALIIGSDWKIFKTQGFTAELTL